MQERTHWLKDVILYLTGQTLSLFGSAVVGYAVIWYIALKTGSGGQYALLLIASSLSTALTTIPGGVWADRYWRKALMIGADAGVAVATIILALFMLNGFENLWLIAGALVLRGLGGGIQSPAVGAALPQIAPSDKLLRINSIRQAIEAIIFVAAPALAAVLLVYLPLGVILFVDVATAVLGIGCTLLVKIPKLTLDPDAPKPEGFFGYFKHIGEAVSYAGKIPGLARSALILMVLMTVVIPFAQMTPVFVVRLYGTEQWMLAAVEILWSIGMVVGGIVMAAWGGLKNRMTMIMISSFMIAAMTLVMGFAPNIWWFLVVMIIAGLSMPLMNTPAITAIQELIPESMMGRVMSFITLLFSICGPIGMAIFGPLADVLDLSWMAFACGAVGIVFLLTLAIKGGPGSQLYAPDKPDDVPEGPTQDAPLPA